MYRFLRTASLSSHVNVLRKLAVFDIDGVVLRGDTPIPGSREAFKNLTDYNIPYVFLTNGCPCSENERLEFLSETLKFKLPEQVMFMANTPFQDLTHEFHKHMLVVSKHDPKNLLSSFTNLCTLEQLATQFPYLDSVNRIFPTIVKKPTDFKPIEGIIFMEDPEHWETAYQLILDVLFTGGIMESGREDYLKMTDSKQLPLYIASTDFLWVTEAPWQRIAHGIFLHNLESVFKRLSGQELKYKEVYGKPNLPTYTFLHKRLKELFSCSSIENIYFIGDNIFTDIYGANMFGNDLQVNSIATKAHSFLVETGVYIPGEKIDSENAMNALHKDTPRNINYLTPTKTFPSIKEAVSHIIKD